MDLIDGAALNLRGNVLWTVAHFDESNTPTRTKTYCIATSRLLLHYSTHYDTRIDNRLTPDAR